MNEQFLRKRKLLTFLPLIALPFMTLLFWSFGGGKHSDAHAASPKAGLNTQLPEAKLSEDGKDKLSLYEQALKDSLQREDFRNADPYGRMGMQQAFADSMALGSNPLLSPQGYNAYTFGPAPGSADATEARLRSRLAELESQLQTAHQAPPPSYEPRSDASYELDQLQASLAAGMQSTGTAEADPELDRIDGILEKVMDIQNPERAKEKLRASSEKNKGMVYAVSAGPVNTQADLFNGDQPSGNKAAGRAITGESSNPKVYTAAFYELTGNESTDQETNKAIPAVIHETQTLTSGATVKMRLTEDVFINGVLIPKGNFLFGTCQLEGERLTVSVKAFRFKNALFPVSLAVYDMDGIEGIKVPGTIQRDAAKGGIDQMLQGLDFTTVNQSVGAQAANAGVQTVKSLFGKKAKLIRATVKAGYPILLMDLNQRNQ